MTKIAIVGDTHGNSSWTHNTVITHAKKQGCDKIFQVGDFGFIWPERDWQRNLDKLSKRLVRDDIELTFLPGNHEDHTRLAEMEANWSKNSVGHTVIRPNLFYSGRYSQWTWDSKKFAAVGGAVSVDREYRLAYMMAKRDRKPTWWKEEILTPEEHQDVLSTFGHVDVLLTHDAPVDFPGNWLKPDLESLMNRQRMSEVGKRLRPRWWFHGHYHHHVVYPFRHEDGECEVTGLDCDGAPHSLGMAYLEA